MMPVIYTTYGMAMRHHPEVLAASGGLRQPEPKDGTGLPLNWPGTSVSVDRHRFCLGASAAPGCG